MKVRSTSLNIDHILTDAIRGKCLTGKEIICLLNLQEEHDIEKLFEAAREVRKRLYVSWT